MALHFSIWYFFFKCCFYKYRCLLTSETCSSSNSFFVIFIYPFAISLKFFPFLYFTPSFFASGCRFAIVLSSPTYQKNFLSLFSNALFYLSCLILSRCHLTLFPSDNIFDLFIPDVRLACRCYFGIISLRWVLMRFIFHSSFASCRSFFIFPLLISGPVVWGYRIHRLHFCRGVKLV